MFLSICRALSDQGLEMTPKMEPALEMGEPDPYTEMDPEPDDVMEPKVQPLGLLSSVDQLASSGGLSSVFLRVWPIHKVLSNPGLPSSRRLVLVKMGVTVADCRRVLVDRERRRRRRMRRGQQ
jgi:hypothetical protein